LSGSLSSNADSLLQSRTFCLGIDSSGIRSLFMLGEYDDNFAETSMTLYGVIFGSM